MSTTLTYDARSTWKKVLAIGAIATAMVLVAGFSYFATTQNASAARPADFGLREGDTISAAGSDDPDIYIVNDAGYKRLFLNPVIFNFYGHLGGFANVKSVSSATRDAFPTSGLFRNCETNDQKVYGVETTGEDTGMLHWVNTPGAQAVIDDPNFFQKVFCINNNEFSWYSQGTAYTSVTQVPNYSRQPGQTTVTPSGPLSISLSPSNPAASTVTKNASGVSFLTVRFSGTGTINQLIFKRTGAGATGDFSNVYLYDGARRLTSGKTLSSSDGTVTFVNLGYAVTGSRDISVVADLAGTGGNVNAIQLVSADSTNGSLSGLPLNGNLINISGASSGTLSLDKVGSIGNPNVGAKQALLTEFKLTTSTEAASIRHIQLLQGGNVKPGDLSNLTLKAGGQQWTGTIDKDGFMVFDLGNGYTVTKGNNQIFYVYGDIGGKKDETVKLYFETATDILGVGDQYGYGMPATIGNLDSTSDAFSLTLQGGVLTLNNDNTLTAQNIGTNTSDTTFLKYSMTAATGIEIRKTKIVLCKDNAGNGTFDSNGNTSGWGDVEDIKISNAVSNVTLVGPADGSTFTANDSDSCPDSAVGAAKTFTDVFEMTAGQTLNLKLTGDIKTANTGGVQITAADVVKFILNNYGDLTTSSGDVSVMKYSGTNTAVTSTDIVPSSDLSGPNMTVQTSALTIGLSGSPISQTFVRGTNNVNLVGFTFQAGQASPLRVTDVTLTGYVADSGTTLVKGVQTGADANLKVGNLIGSIGIYEAESGALLSATPVTNNLGNSTGTAIFNNLTWDIPAGSTKTLLVRVNLSSNATSGSSDVVAFDIATTTDITALDNNSNTVNPGTSTPNSTTTPTRILTVANSGSITMALAPESPTKKALYWGQTGEEVSRFRFSATNESALIEKLEVASIASISGTAATAANARDTVKTVWLTYTTKDGRTLTSGQSISNAGSAVFGFTGADRPYIPKDATTDIVAKVDLKTKSDGLGSSQNNIAINLSISEGDGRTTDSLKIIGEGSGAITTSTTASINDVGGNDMYVYRVFPEFTKITDTAFQANSSVLTPSDSEVLRFTITARGLPDAKLFFDNQSANSQFGGYDGGSTGTSGIGSGAIRFEIVASGNYSGGNSVAFDLYKIEGGADVLLDSQQDAINNAVISGTTRASVAFDFSTADLEITGGQTKTLYVRAALNRYSDTGDYFQLILRDDENGLISWVANTTGATTDLDTQSTKSILRNLPLFGTTKVKTN